MKTAISFLTCLLLTGASGTFQAPDKNTQNTIRFEVIDVYVDCIGSSLAAYQFELSEKQGRITIVGVEGGEHEAFQKPPYYDPAALQNNRIIIADFHTGTEVPRGKTRVARVHLQVSGDGAPEYQLTLMAAADSEGNRIPAQISLTKKGDR